MKRNLLLLFFIATAFQGLTQSRYSEEGHLIKKDTITIDQYLFHGKQLEDSVPDSSIYYYQQARMLALKTEDVKRAASAYLSLFLLLFKQNNYAKAFALAREEINTGQQWHNDELQARGYNNLAIAYQYLSDYQDATDYYLKAAALAGKMGKPFMEAKILDNMTPLFLKLKNYRMAYSYGLRSYNLSMEKKDTLFITSSLISMGNALGGMKKYDSALLCLDRAERMARQAQKLQKVMIAIENKGFVYTLAGKPDSAIHEFQQALALAKQEDYPYLIATSLNGLANNEAIKNHYKKAERYAAEAISIAQEQALGNELLDIYDNMASIKQKLGKPSEALAYKALYEQIKDSIMNVQIQTNITRMNIQYNTAKKDKEILQQKLQLAGKQAAIHKKNTWLLIAVIFLGALATILVTSFRSYKNKKRLHVQTVHALQKEQEVVRLKALMQGKDEERQRISKEMHDDIGSGLTSILYLSNQLKFKAKTETNHVAEKIQTHVNILIGKMNEIIWSMNTDYDSLEDLVIYLRHHAGEMLENAGIAYHFDIPSSIPERNLSGEERRNIYLVIKEALHNIIKHAQATNVNIALLFDHQIHITVSDNGKGFAEHQIHAFSNGLKNMKDRMKSIGGSIAIKSNPGVTISLTAPISG